MRISDWSSDVCSSDLSFQHLLLSIIGFGLRVYSQHHDVVGHAARWSGFHERVARAILDGGDSVQIDTRGRLIILDDNPSRKPPDFDKDGFDETLIIGREAAGSVAAGQPAPMYARVRAPPGTWPLSHPMMTK